MTKRARVRTTIHGGGKRHEVSRVDKDEAGCTMTIEQEGGGTVELVLRANKNGAVTLRAFNGMNLVRLALYEGKVFASPAGLSADEYRPARLTAGQAWKGGTDGHDTPPDQQ